MTTSPITPDYAKGVAKLLVFKLENRTDAHANTLIENLSNQIQQNLPTVVCSLQTKNINWIAAELLAHPQAAHATLSALSNLTSALT